MGAALLYKPVVYDTLCCRTDSTNSNGFVFLMWGIWPLRLKTDECHYRNSAFGVHRAYGAVQCMRAMYAYWQAWFTPFLLVRFCCRYLLRCMHDDLRTCCYAETCTIRGKQLISPKHQWQPIIISTCGGVRNSLYDLERKTFIDKVTARGQIPLYNEQPRPTPSEPTRAQHGVDTSVPQQQYFADVLKINVSGACTVT